MKNSKQMGDTFERFCQQTFDGYFRAGLASIDMMPVPTKVIGFSQYGPKIIYNGKAPFDAYGYTHAGAQMIGAEFKVTGKPETSIAIVGEKQDGCGIEYHQLDALYQLAKAGGIARIVWNNGGQIGVLTNDKIMAAWQTYDDAMKTERHAGMRAKLGSKSIRWEEFDLCQQQVIGGIISFEWLFPQPRRTSPSVDPELLSMPS